MAAGVRQAEITLVLRALNEMGAPLREAQNQVANFADSVGRGLRGALGVASAAVTVAGGAIAAWTVHATMGALRAEEMTVALAALAKAQHISVDSLNSYVAAIRHQGIEMSVAQNLVAEFVQGHLDLAKATGLAKVAQDAAVISGSNSTETLARLVQGIRTQQTEVIRATGITIDAQTAYQKYAETHHIAASAIDNTTKQQIILDEVLKQGTTIQGAYAAALETPSKQLRSLPRILDDISLNVGRSFLPALGGIITSAYEMAKAISTATEKGKPLANVLDSIGKYLNQMLAPVQGVVKGIETFLKTLDNAKMQAFLDTVGKLAPILATLGAALGAAGLREIPFIGQFLPAINPVLAGLAGLVASSAPLQDAFGKLVTALEPAFTALGPALSALLNTASAGLNDLATAFSPIIAAVGQFAVQVAPSLIDMLTAVRPLIPAFVELVVAATPLLVQMIGIATMAVEFAQSSSILVPIVAGLAAAWLAWNGLLLINNVQLAINAALAGGPGLGAFLIRVIAVAVAMGPLNVATGLWNLLLSANPVGLVIIALAALVALVALAVTHWDQLRGALSAVYDKLTPVKAVVEHVGDAFRVFSIFIKEGFGQTKAFEEALQALGVPMGIIKPLASGLSAALDGIRAALDGIKTVINVVATFIGTFVEKIKAGEQPISALAGALIAVHAPLGLIQGAMQVLNAITEGVGKTFAPVSKALQEAGKELGPSFRELGTSFGAAWTVIDKGLKGLLPLVGQLGAFIKTNWWTIAGVISPLIPVIAQIAGLLGQILKPVLIAIGIALAAVGAIVVALVAGSLAGLVAFLVVAIPAAIKIVVGVIQILIGIITFFVDLFTGRWDRLGADLMRIVAGFTNVIVGNFELLVLAPLSAMKAFVEAVVGFFQWLFDKVVGHSILPDMINAIIAWFQNMVGWVTAPLSALWGGIEYWFRRVYDSALYWVTSLANVVKGVWDGMVSAAGGAASGIWGAIKDGLNVAIDVADQFITKARDFLHTFGLHTLDSVWIPKLASGGFVPTGEGFMTSGPVAVVGEGNPVFPEVVIPTDPHYRRNAMALLIDAARRMGMALAGGGVLGEYVSSPWWQGSWPVTQVPYTPGGSHANANAWDYAMPMGTTIMAGAPGVASTGADPGGYGNYIRYFLDAGGSVILGHLQQILATGHATVGQVLALSDNTGFSTGPHLHFELLGAGADTIGAGKSSGKILAGLVDAALNLLKNQITGNDWGSGIARVYLDMMGKGVKGLLPFDQGGVWPPGTAGVNMTGQPEYVFTADQMRKMGGGSGQVTINVTVNNPGASATEIAREIAWAMRTAH